MEPRPNPFAPPPPGSPRRLPPPGFSMASWVRRHPLCAAVTASLIALCAWALVQGMVDLWYYED